MSAFSVSGNITAMPELRFTPNGKATASFTVAENRKRGDEDVTSFFDVVTWDTLAENVAESLDKGMRVVVTGRLEQRSWNDKEGNKRSRIEVIADSVGPDLRWAVAAVTKNDRN